MYVTDHPLKVQKGETVRVRIQCEEHRRFRWEVFLSVFLSVCPFPYEHSMYVPLYPLHYVTTITGSLSVYSVRTHMGEGGLGLWWFCGCRNLAEA